MPIEKEDILEPLAFQFPNKFKIIDAFITELTRQNIVKPEVKFSASSVDIDFSILEKAQGFKLQVIFAGEEYTKPNLKGIIKEVDNFDSKEELTIENILHGVAIVLLYTVGFLVFCAVIALIIVLFNLALKKAVPEKEKDIKKSLEKFGLCIIIGLSLIAVLLMFLVMERFFRNLKGVWIPEIGYRSFEEAELMVNQYMTGYYSQYRPHQHNGGLPPNQTDDLHSRMHL